jgi:hypothetical protein
MQIIKKEIPAIFYEEIIYDELGESDGEYSIGDKIEFAKWTSGYLVSNGKITKIVHSEHPYNSKHYCQLDNDNERWVNLNGNDKITILEKYKKQNSQI